MASRPALCRRRRPSGPSLGLNIWRTTTNSLLAQPPPVVCAPPAVVLGLSPRRGPVMATPTSAFYCNPSTSTRTSDSVGLERHPSCSFGLSATSQLINHQPTIFFYHNKLATSNQPTVLFSQNESTPANSHQPNEQACNGVNAPCLRRLWPTNLGLATGILSACLSTCTQAPLPTSVASHGGAGPSPIAAS
jgi:hypothetical protein